MKKETLTISSRNRKMKVIVLRPEDQAEDLPALLWIHGGGYALGMASMVRFSIGKLLAKRHGAVVFSPEYTLSGKAPYPAAFDDCYETLKYIDEHHEELGIDRNRIIVGGESAGGGLAAAICLKARDEGSIKIRLQIPLYPMLDCEDTDSSTDNHGHVWNTKRNHWGWSRYLKDTYGTENVDKYASPSRETDYRRLPDCITFVKDGEPFYDETMTYVIKLNEAGVKAQVRVFHGKTHAFDLMTPWKKDSREARKWIIEETKPYFE